MCNFKRCLLVLIILIFSTINCFADEKKEEPIDKADLEKQISYALGYDIFDKLQENFDLDLDAFTMGARDNFEKQPKLTEEKLKQTLVSYQRIARQKQIERIKIESKENREKGLKFLEDNKLKTDIVTLPSGLQYKVIAAGDGALPKATDTVECHYKGTLIDGTVFDSSYQRGKPATFQVGGVI
ncbi:MAG TPA: FKBP-type peptidyl-prolyl cis-trans isomerase, partial [Desulfobacterales bacterium]|nr:FKBP-type peptidyl-prolyl cis-trans isomerase [Desulfobacterales bacterium]